MRQIVFSILLTSFIIIGCTSNAFAQINEQKVVSLPFEMLIDEEEKLLIKENGFIRFCNEDFMYKKNGTEYPIHEARITLYSKNNLYGVNILEDVGGAFTSYTLVINIKTKKEIPYAKDINFRFWDFLSIENCFILASAEKAYAYNDLTGELLWTQTYRQKDGRKIILNGDHFIIDDVDGNRYGIYINGQKIKL